MSKRDAYLLYEAGQAVAAAHLGLTIRHVSGNPALLASDIVIPHARPKARMILWLTGMAAEKKGLGRSDPLRRTRNRMRIRAQVESAMADMTGSPSKRLADARHLLSQAQDRANAICTNLFPAIQQVVNLLRDNDSVPGDQIVAIVQAVKAARSGASPDELPDMEPSAE
jgi:hypothetical protein